MMVVTPLKMKETPGWKVSGQSEAELAALKQASKTLDELLTRREVDTEAVVADFKKARKHK